MAPRDRALRTAREILDQTVCECGHVLGDHSTGDPPNDCGADDGGCACPQFQPGRFSVERAALQVAT